MARKRRQRLSAIATPSVRFRDRFSLVDGVNDAERADWRGPALHARASHGTSGARSVSARASYWPIGSRWRPTIRSAAAARTSLRLARTRRSKRSPAFGPDGADPAATWGCRCIRTISRTSSTTGSQHLRLRASPGLLAILRRGGITNGHVLDLGCGDGTWLRALTERGFVSERHRSIRRSRAIRAERRASGNREEESVHRAAFPRCNAITAVGEVLSYLPSRTAKPGALRRLFRRAYAALAARWPVRVRPVRLRSSDVVSHLAERARMGGPGSCRGARRPPLSSHNHVPERARPIPAWSRRTRVVRAHTRVRSQRASAGWICRANEPPLRPFRTSRSPVGVYRAKTSAQPTGVHIR